MYTYLYVLSSKFTKAMEVLQGDIEAVENERDTLKRQLETQSHVAIPPDISGVRRSASLSGVCVHTV